MDEPNTECIVLLGKSFCPPVAQLGAGYHADSYIGLDALQVPRKRQTPLRRGVPCYSLQVAFRNCSTKHGADMESFESNLRQSQYTQNIVY